MVVTVLILALYFVFKGDPTCFDGKLNQGEVGVDCGGPCKPCVQKTTLEKLEIISVEWVHDKDEYFDGLIRTKNPNEGYGAAKFRYRITFKDSAGNEVGQSQWEENFALPREEKSLLVQGVRVSGTPYTAEAEIDQENVDWDQFQGKERPVFIVNNKRYQVSTGGELWFAKASGTLINKSAADFQEVLVKVILRDDREQLLAVNSQMINALRSEEERDYIITFPHGFPGSVSDTRVEVETNVFDPDNYLRIIGR